MSASGRVPVLRHGPRYSEGGKGAAGPGGTAGRTSGDRVVALTFDAALSPEDAKRAAEDGVRHDNPALFTALRRAKAPATVFMTGVWARTHRDRARAIGRDRLFEVGSLSLSHHAFTPDCADLPALAPDRHLAEVREGLKEIRAAGVARPTPYFRFPGGCHDDRSRRAVAPAGVTAVAGDVDAADTGASDPEELAGRVLKKIRPGSVVILRWDRERAPATAAAVGRLVPELRGRGYRLVHVSELVAAAMGRAPAPSPASSR
ncbi:polysaccharide deacetylase [Streptomyces carminius]|uniref:Polysaccharide deacetylase n=1 Tax=Streptomyces carminius TaxID=2665496 RepID=A0A2M8LPR0_9ACTN|nr:polysaccharide deacetylase [Streptomyces carminius]